MTKTEDLWKILRREVPFEETLRTFNPYLSDKEITEIIKNKENGLYDLSLKMGWFEYGAYLELILRGEIREDKIFHIYSSSTNLENARIGDFGWMGKKTYWFNRKKEWEFAF